MMTCGWVIASSVHCGLSLRLLIWSALPPAFRGSRQQLARLLVPPDLPRRQTVASVAIGADDPLGVGLGALLLPSGDDLHGRNVVALVARLAAFGDPLRRKHHVRRRDVVLVVAMGERRPVALHATDVRLGVRPRRTAPPCSWRGSSSTPDCRPPARRGGSFASPGSSNSKGADRSTRSGGGPPAFLAGSSSAARVAITATPPRQRRDAQQGSATRRCYQSDHTTFQSFSH